MSFEVWLLFAATEFVLSLSPGPAVLLVLSVSMTHGRIPGMQTAAGILSANVAYFMLSATSVGAILLTSWKVFFLIKWLGAAFLVWMGIKMLLAKEDNTFHSTGQSRLPRTGWRIFRRGFLVQGANPKALVYFAALLPQFVTPAAPVAPQIGILALTSIVLEFGILAGYATLASGASRFANGPRFANVLHRIGGVLLICAAVGLAVLKRD